MTQTIALLVDAYRELNARKMFWISLIISALVMVGFALLGLNDKGLTLLGMELKVPAPRFIYKYVFSTVVIGIWVSVGAMILALISTASIFPDLLASGSIDLYLAKPISRLRLFLTKYLGGLLFVLLQATVFAVGGYLVFGIRAGQWRPSLFLIIPLATLLFSYLFVVCVFVGVLTRSTIAAILVTCLFWFLCFVGNKAEQTLFMLRTMQSAEARAFERQAQQADANIEELHKHPTMSNAFGFRERRLAQRRDELRQSAGGSQKAADKLITAHRIVRIVVSVIPKTGETVDLLDRTLFNDADLGDLRKQMAKDADNGNGPFGMPPPPRRPPPPEPIETPSTSPTTREAENLATKAEDKRESDERRASRLEVQEETERAARSRSLAWLLGTSIGFEAVLLSLAAWVFCRRDY